MTNKKLALYIHIPFCIQKCNYCDFLSFVADEKTRDAYVSALLSEIESYRESPLAEREITSLFIGGGTPSVLSEEQIQKIILKIKSVFNIQDIDKEDDVCEISMEINPGTVTPSKCKCYENLGINRVSLGLQSVNDQELQNLGRIHNYEQFLESYKMLREAGIKNINIDLMSALPGQSVDSYCRGLEKVLALRPEHISAYSLIIEEGTPFYKKYHNNCDLLPDEDSERLMYYRTKEILEKYGYKRYEISNYALPGYECRHNKVYWQRGDYLGLGLGSASLIDHTRYRNTEKMEEYLDRRKPISDGSAEKSGEELSETAEMEEFMFLGLRMMEGVSFREFEKQFGKPLYEVYGKVIEKYKKTGYLQIYTKVYNVGESGITEKFLALTDKGVDVSNYIFEEFLLS